MKGLLVGYGSIGRRHLGNLHGLGVDDWAVVRTGRGTLPFEPPCPVRTYADLDEALATEHPDFAVVANPTSLHVATARRCVDAGCAVLLEKPVSHDLGGVDDLRAAVADRGVGVAVAFQFRYHPALEQIRDLVADRVLGPALHAHLDWGEYLPDWHPWEDWRASHASRRDLGGGVLHVAHPLDYARMLFGDPVRVGGILSDLHPLGLDVPEAADVTLQFPDGPTVTSHVDYWRRTQMHTVVVTCTDGTITWDYMTGELRIRAAGASGWSTVPTPGVADRNDLFVALARDFLGTVRSGTRPACTLDDGIAVAHLADAVERSSARGGVLVDLA